ncbi:MFS transporter [Bacteriovorax sp. PP10]|uniref:MFS transporter n=1 Tax=Bacteriovorax antarcticus TaxID=3088717 RepID=A0ABU5VUT0_9BACT|nr:MFS transporter [Bacteriovorax sp. PP10]MEA9355790.1 MFS transporter [Bacteriovorax sp. PP10]
MTSKRFWPIFWTQFFGAMNDNVFKNALVILITYQATSVMGLRPEQMVALCGGLFILPFFLFSAIAGELTDKFPMHQLVRATKILELFIVCIGTIGFCFNMVPLLLLCLFLLGVQSTLFGPVKYSILPELITEDELVKGNAFVEMGTFLAILIGTITGGLLIAGNHGALSVSVTTVIMAIVGVAFSFQVSSIATVDSKRKINFNIFSSTVEIIKISRKTRSVFISILGISWFWFFGATLLSVFPVYVKTGLYGDEHVVTLLLAIFSIGVAIGSVICEKLSHERLELGLVPFGSIGLSLFVLDLYFAGALPSTEVARGVTELLGVKGIYRILFDLMGLSIMSGFFIVPLYTFIQTRSERNERARVVAANNILNALFMVASAGVLVGLYALGLSAIDVFLALFVLNTLVAIYIYTIIPEFLLRFVCFILTRMIYRLKVDGHKHIPQEGPAVLICNHISFVDWLIVASSVKRPVRFVMHYSFTKIPFVSFLLRGAKVIPIAGTKEDPKIMDEAFVKIKETLDEGEIVCIFPEGQITKDGTLSPFRPGIERILADSNVPVIPMTIYGLWGSFFSRKYGHAASELTVIPRRIWSKVIVDIDPAFAGDQVNAKILEEHTLQMLTRKK